AESLEVERAAPVYETVGRLGAERIVTPVSFLRRDDVAVAQQRDAGARDPAQASDQIDPAGRSLQQLDLDPLRLQPSGEPLGGAGLVPGAPGLGLTRIRA